MGVTADKDVEESQISMKRQTVSLCMITRNEEGSVGLAIKSVLALVDEVIVVDTGSQDNTRIIAEGYGARVIDMPWQDDFAAARNIALAEATGDWILVLDADERVQPLRPVEFQRLLNMPGVAGYRVQMVSPRNKTCTQTFHLVRLFRNQPEVRYRYPIHEQIVPSLNAWAEEQGMVVAESTLVVVHEGYRRERSAEKRDRNQRILRKAITAYPGESYFEYQLACETLSRLDDEVLPVAGRSSALINLEHAWQKVQSLGPIARKRLAYGPDLVAMIAACRLTRNCVPAARQIIGEGRELYGDHPSLLLQSIAADCRYLLEYAGQLDVEERGRLLESARRDIHNLREAKLTNLAAPTDERCQTLYPLRYLGELALMEGKVGEAAELFEKALTVDSSYSFAWLGLAECARFAGDRKRALKLYLRTVTENEWNHRAWLRGCSLLEELEFHDNAASWRRKVALHFPEHPLAASLGCQEVFDKPMLLTTG